MEQFIGQWPDSSADQRFAAFVDWIARETLAVSVWLDALDIQRDATAAPLVREGESRFLVAPDVFDAGAPDLALDIGQAIIIALLYSAADNAQAEQERMAKLEKERRKYYDKVLEKLLKDAKPKGDPGYADWYYSYYLPKLYGEYGSP